MTRDWDRPPQEPTPEQLAAYFDDGLTGPARGAVEAWLADHPDAARHAPFADGDDGLTRAWLATQPADPSPAAWSGVAGRVAAALAPVGHPQARRRAWLVFGLGAAAAAVSAVLVARSLWWDKPKPTTIEPRVVVRPPEDVDDEKEPFALAAPTEVRIISMEGDDTEVEIDGQMVKTLVVGEPPVADTVLMPTSYARTRLVATADPSLRFEDWGVPMIVDPAVLANGWQP